MRVKSGVRRQNARWLNADRTKHSLNRPANVVHDAKKVSAPSNIDDNEWHLNIYFSTGAGICTVFGDPHYKTFDGKFFSFQGSCKYQLTADCVNQSFSIRVTNDGRSTKSSSWIKTVTLKMPTVRVNLGQKMRVKVNGTRVIPPYKLDNLLDIQRTDEGISVVTEIGINLLWDGSNFLQVQAATSYKKKLCGLCGNYSKCITRSFVL